MATTTAGHADRPRRYTATAQALHWVVAALMFSVLPLAWAMTSLPRGAPNRDLLYMLHKSVGMTILVLAIVRTAWRVTHRPPPPTTRTGRLEHLCAEAAHVMLYAILIGMPVSGYVLSSAGGNPVSIFGLFDVSVLPRSDTAQRAAVWAHVFVGQWLVYALLALHLAAVAFHVAVRRDGLLDRMVPAQEEQEERETLAAARR